ncbi:MULTISPECIES: bile acid:sodium symporter family protein [Vibrio]|uniref:Na(+)-dependent transporter n=1 Tax=Vibrio metoecus TaxID=1481663 RepID=A0A271VQE5_VIBMT|nr:MULTISPECIES: bile acid:sodium symporter [Vibrio]KDO15290.1 Na(+)-dependent transporter [Vibrio metoecus]KQB10796.1 Na(+)-dependent transporter [Vibrio metoecus]MDP4492074.1 bile acid:sodium symporter [Vibrio sp. AH4]PAR20284.1 Na(+)-dependent transporter [Vibrio metoecus]PAR24819.1 Na(+)-dependent transporter [Vibrio metoecus]
MAQLMLTIGLPIALAWMMFCVGITLSVADFKRVSEYPGKIALGLTAQLIGLPLIAYLLIHTFALPEVVAVGLWILALAPGGASSNAISHLAGGDAALSITMTAVSSLIIPFSLPLLLPLVLTEVSTVIPLKTAILQLMVVTLLPVTLGMLLHHFCKGERFHQFSAFAGKTALWALFFTVAVTLAANTAVFTQLFSIAALMVLLLCLLGMGLGVVCAKLLSGDAKLTKTFAIEVGIQNAGTAIFVAIVQLQQPELALTPLLYGVLMNLPAVMLIAWNKQKTVKA